MRSALASTTMGMFVPAGINVVSGRDRNETYTTYDSRFAVNVSRRSDAEVAANLLGRSEEVVHDGSEALRIADRVPHGGANEDDVLDFSANINPACPAASRRYTPMRFRRRDGTPTTDTQNFAGRLPATSIMPSTM